VVGVRISVQGEREGQVHYKFLEIIANDFIRDTDYLENKAKVIACKTRTLSASYM